MFVRSSSAQLVELKVSGTLPEHYDTRTFILDYFKWSLGPLIRWDSFSYVKSVSILPSHGGFPNCPVFEQRGFISTSSGHVRPITCAGCVAETGYQFFKISNYSLSCFAKKIQAFLALFKYKFFKSASDEFVHFATNILQQSNLETSKDWKVARYQLDFTPVLNL